MKDYSTQLNILLNLQTFNTADDICELTWSLDKSFNSEDIFEKLKSNWFKRLCKSYNTLFDKCGGVNNMVFFRSDFVDCEEILPVYASYSEGVLRSESCFKVKDVNKVDDIYRNQVETL